MSKVIDYPNRLAEERELAGIATPEDLASFAGIEPSWYARMEAGEILPTLEEFDRIRAVLGGVEPARLYVHSGLVGTIGGNAPTVETPDFAGFWGGGEDTSRLLVTRDEATWLTRNTTPDREVDVFLSMSCNAARSPHILMDMVNVFRTLEVNFAAGAGRLFCCGTYYRAYRETDAAQRMLESSVGRQMAWAAKQTVTVCTQCTNTFTETARREQLRGAKRPVNRHLYEFLEELFERRGSSIPWKREVPAKVLVLRQDFSPVHTRATETCARVLSRVPGVEVVGFVDDEMVGIVGMKNGEQLVREPAPSPDEIRDRRARVAELFAARGADTMAAMHHTGQQWWSRFSSDGVTVRSPISIIAAALDCVSPDRYQAACQLGDPDAILEQTRPIWTSWDLPEERARAVVNSTFLSAYAVGPSRCGCGGGENGCSEQLIDVDVVSATIR